MKFKLLLFISLTLFIYNCGSKNTDLTPEASKSTIKGAPDWYLDTPSKDGYIIVPSSATSQDMQLAVNKATLDASNTLASMIRSDMNALVKRVREEIGQDDDSDLLDTFSSFKSILYASQHSYEQKLP